MSVPKALISLHKVSFSFSPLGNSSPVLYDLSLDIYPSRMITLIGPNGAGKTTFLKLALGLIQPTQGTITRHHPLITGYMPQKLGMNPLMPCTVERLLDLSSPSFKNKEKIKMALEEVGCLPLLNQSIHHLSGGERQRIMLARALIQEPDLLVLDEPTQGMDIIAQENLYALISNIRQKRQCAIILVSHDLYKVMRTSEEVICLNGHICCSGPPDLVKQHPSYQTLFPDMIPPPPPTTTYTHHHDHCHDSRKDHRHD